eukprot:TRINITY_DN1479_c0_g1_i3.p1 TRINITY_DN1479_c0_g1~~TRINITY_DN1479_c0_g1_i3.p1  ORF type:complete len:633 (+),score=45.43 TRINITY_DN1479_c0_g1_i3:87-1985(+)
MDMGTPQYVLVWTLRAVVFGVVLIYVWLCREKLLRLCTSLLACCKSRMQASHDPEHDPFATHVEEEFQQLRLARFTMFLNRMMPSATFYYFGILTQSLMAGTSDADALWSVVSMIFSPGPVYVLGIYITTERWSLSRCKLDLMIAYIYAALSARVVLYEMGIQYFQYRTTSSVRVAGQCFLTATYLDFKKSFLANLSLSVVQVVAYAQHETSGTAQLQETISQFVAREFLLFAMIMVLGYVMEDAGRVLVRRGIEVKNSEASGRAVESILDVLCDAVVHVGSNMRFLRDCPQLGHLLLSGISTTRPAGTAHARCSFLQHVVEDDRARCTEFVARQAENASKYAGNNIGDASTYASPNSIHVSLRDARGTVFQVQIIHASLIGFVDDGHLLGIRDLGDPARKFMIQTGDSHDVPDVQEAGSQTKNSVASKSSSGASVSSRSSGRCDLESYNVTLLVDVFDEQFPVHEAVLKPTKSLAGSCSLPLSTLVSSDSYLRLTEWLTNTVNDKAYGLETHPIKNISLASSGDGGFMRAGRVDVHIEGDVSSDLFSKDSCLATLHLEELAILVSNHPRPKGRKRHKPILPRIQETTSVSWGVNVSSPFEVATAETRDEPARSKASSQGSMTGDTQSSISL